MIVPVRCMSCGKPIGHLWEKYQEKIAKADEKTDKEAANLKKQALDELGLERYCCRSVFMGHVDLMDLAAHFKKH